MISWNEFLSSITEDEFRAIILDHEKFSNDGFIGDCTLRVITRRWIDNINSTANVTIWMDRIAFEAYKYFANKYLTKEEL